jgi:hypothetical protein
MVAVVAVVGRIRRLLSGVLVVGLLVAASTACRPKIPADAWKAPGVLPAVNYLYLESDADDPLLKGSGLLATQATANISTDYYIYEGFLRVIVDDVYIEVATPTPDKGLEPGYYPDTSPTRGQSSWPHLSVRARGSSCALESGWFGVDAITVDGRGELQAVDLRFVRHCDGASGATRGQFHWVRGDPTGPPGPTPIPADLWRPAPGTTPATGNFLRVESEPGDAIGQGRSTTYTQANATLRLFGGTGGVSAEVLGDERWVGDFGPMASRSVLEPGFYGGVGTSVGPTMSWGARYTGCRTRGWFAVDAIALDAGRIVSFDARFEQRCDDGTGVLRGQVRIAPGDMLVPPGPTAPPAGLWRAPAGSTPATGNYLFIDSRPGDPLAYGRTYLFAAPDTVTASGSSLGVGVEARRAEPAIDWLTRLTPMVPRTRLEPGYYGELRDDRPARGDLSVDVTGLGLCSEFFEDTWFMVDAVGYSGDQLRSIEARFGFRCTLSSAPVYGQLRWRAP